MRKSIIGSLALAVIFFTAADMVELNAASSKPYLTTNGAAYDYSSTDNQDDNTSILNVDMPDKVKKGVMTTVAVETSTDVTELVNTMNGLEFAYSDNTCYEDVVLTDGSRVRQWEISVFFSTAGENTGTLYAYSSQGECSVQRYVVDVIQTSAQEWKLM